jgi:hypothetical protein
LMPKVTPKIEAAITKSDVATCPSSITGEGW